MPCRRCSGMMVKDLALDETGRADYSVWRCIICGNIIDPVILINRTTKWSASKKRAYVRRAVSWSA